MKIDDIIEIYDLIASRGANSSSRKIMPSVRKEALATALNKNGLIKVAFDTRRINQEIEYIPRRGLQNYHRSEDLISDSISNKIQAFTKLTKILDQLKLEYGREPEWQDSYTRVLSSAINKGLRLDQNDNDYSDAQPSVGSFDYLEELIHVRYRLTVDNLMSMSDFDLRNIILKKDDLLIKGGKAQSYLSDDKNISKNSYDQIIDKMLNTMAKTTVSTKDNLVSQLFDIKATKDCPEIERTVTITIKDKMIDPTLQMEKVAIEENYKNKETKL